MNHVFVWIVLVLLAARAPLQAGSEAPGTTPAREGAAIEVPGIHNAFRVAPRIYSGSQPEGDIAFAALAQLGVKTIISVDGSQPDLAGARKHGLRYVHLPFGYDGISAERAAQLQKAAQTIEGTIFIHCHHGKHRGPAAVGIVCESTEGWTPQRAENWLRQAGTAHEYPGLYQAVREFHPLDPEKLAALGALPETTKTEALVDRMVAMDEQFDAIKALQKAGWKTSSGDPSQSPATGATLLWELFRELARNEDTAQRTQEYRAKLADAERAALALQAALRATPPDLVAADAAFRQSSQSCTTCHRLFRNEKPPTEARKP